MNKKMSFEAAMKKLEEIVAKLDQNDLTLDETVKLYKEGNELSYFCYQKLKQAENEIQNFTVMENDHEQNQ